MNQLERDIINKNIVALLETTLLSTLFLTIFQERGVFSNGDLKHLDAKKYEGQPAQVKEFYNIILARTEAFDVLKYALEKTSQSEALLILNQTQLETQCKSQRYQKFLGVPDYITAFLNGSENLLILCTTDYSLSAERLEENVSHSIIYNVKKILRAVPRLLSEDRCKKSVIIVKSRSEIRRVLEAAKRIPQKTILITNNGIDGSIQDRFAWNDLSPIQQDSIRDKIDSLISNTQLTEELLRKLEHETLADFLNNKPTQLFIDTIPSDLPYYVSRRFVTRCALTDELFRTGGKLDIFVFVDIEKWKLAEHCNSNSISTSRLFLNDNDPSCRYLLLEDDDDFGKILTKVEVPVHLIRYHNNCFQWLRSEKKIELIQNMIAGQQQQEILREEEFLQSIRTNSKLSKPICVSDTPGMGKSVLLARIGKLLLDEKEHIVCFVRMGELMKSVKEQIGNNSDLKAMIEKYLRNTICSNIVARHVLKAKLRYKTLEIELLLDGFDEIDSNDFELACKFLKTILGSYPSIRLWVTTRPHLLDFVENILGVLGHNIQELNFDDQLHFLTKYWSQFEKFNHKKLESFAKHCLSCLRDNMNSDDKIIAGIPLQCLLVAEVYKDKVKPYCAQNGSEEHGIEIVGSIVKLYELFIEKKIRRFSLRYSKRAVCDSDIFNAHITYSFDVIFPGKDFSKIRENLETESIDMEQLLDVGILEQSSTQNLPRFIHRTFAEYFLSLHFANVLKSPVDKLTQTFLFGTVFRTKRCNVKVNQITIAGNEFQYAVICYFMDKFVDSSLAKLIQKPSARTILREAVNASVYHNFFNLFKYLRDICLSRICVKFEDIFSDKLSLQKLVLLCCNRCRFSFIREISDYYERSRQYKMRNLSIIVPRRKACIYITPLHVAVKRGNFEIVNYLITRKGFVDIKSNIHNDVLHMCVMDSLNEDKCRVDQRIQIFKRLANIDGSLLGGYSGRGELPIFEKSVHVDFLIALLQMAPYKKYYTEVVIAKLSRETIKTLPANEYEKLLKFIYESFCQDNNFRDTIFICEPRERLLGRSLIGSYNECLLQAIVHHSEPTMGTVQLFKEVYSGIRPDEKQGNSLLKLALEKENKAKYLDSLREPSHPYEVELWTLRWFLMVFL